MTPPSFVFKSIHLPLHAIIKSLLGEGRGGEGRGGEGRERRGGDGEIPAPV